MIEKAGAKRIMAASLSFPTIAAKIISTIGISGKIMALRDAGLCFSVMFLHG